MKNKILIWMIALILLCGTAHASLTDGLDLYYSLEENGATPYVDDVGNLNFTNADVPTRTTGVINFGQSFVEANENYLSTANDVIVVNANWTLNFWHNPTDYSDYQRIKWYTAGKGCYFTMAQTTGKWYSTCYKSGGTFGSTANTGPGTGVWTMVTLTHTQGTAMQIYYNGTEVGYDSQTSGTAIYNANEFLILGESATVFNLDGVYDEIGFWNRELSSSEVTELFNNYTSGCGYPFNCGAGPGATTDIDFTITDQWNSSSILSFHVNVSWNNGSTTEHSTSNGTVSLVNVSDGTINVTYWNMTDYFNAELQNEVITANTSNSVTTDTYQAYVCFNATAKVNEAWAYADNFTIDSTTQECFNITAGSHNVMAQKSGWYSQNQTFTITALSNTTQTVQNMSYANLTIYAIDGTTNESLTNYDLWLNSISTPSFGESASGVTNHSYYLINDTYNVTIDVPGYAVTTSLANVTVDGHTNYTFTLYKSNSVTITIRDEITNDIITENITVRWTSNSTTWENTTSTGELFVHNITADEYEVTFYGSNYSTRSYTITVGNDSTQFLTAYMISSLYSTIFTIKDVDTGVLLDDVSFTMYKLINSTWTVVESKYSDISGRVQVYYDPIASYRFYLSRDDYDDLIFYLNPILFSEYDVFMIPESSLNYTVDYDDISIIYSPGPFQNNANSTLNFLISSPTGLLTSYGVTATYPGGNDTATGVQAIGEQLTLDINITGATRWDRVTLTFNYTTSLAGNRTFTRYLGIETNATASENTWLANKDRTFGLGLFERMLIVTIIVIFCVGIATMVGQPIPGIALGLFVFGFMVYIGFAPLWLILPSMLIGVLFLVWKSGGY